MVSSRVITPKFVLSVSTDVGRNLTGERIRTTISYKMYFAKVKKKIVMEVASGVKVPTFSHFP